MVKDMYFVSNVSQKSGCKKYLKESNHQLLPLQVNRITCENRVANNILYFKRAFAEKLWKIITEVSFTEELISSNILKTFSVFNLKEKWYQKLACDAKRKNCRRLRPNTKKTPTVSFHAMHAQERRIQIEKRNCECKCLKQERRHISLEEIQRPDFSVGKREVWKWI